METLQKFSTPLSILIAGVVIAGAVLFALRPGSGGTTAGNQPASPPVDVKDLKIGADDAFIGSATAPVTLAYWSDYQCPFCKQFEVTVLPTLMANYVSKGKLRIVFKDFPFLGSDSTTGAEYAHAVWQLYPDKFLAWHEAMFKAQDAEGDQGFGDEASIVKLSGTIQGIDATKLKALVAQKKSQFDAMATADQQEGVAFGVQGTPGFVTGKKLIAGAEALNVFTAAIDAQLK